jgi:hypothetical protein
MLEQDRLELFNFLCSLNKRGVFWCLSLKATYAATGFILILLIGDRGRVFVTLTKIQYKLKYYE